MNERFAFTRERFEVIDRHFEKLNEQMNRRFESSDRRFDDLVAHSDKRFDDLIRHSDKRFEAVEKRFNSMTWMISVGFVVITSLTTVFALLA